MKKLHAKIKEPIQVVVELPDTADFSENWLVASSVIETVKKRMIEELRSKMHEKIAVLGLDDIEFKILD